jgi:hypothetical protein
VDGFAVHAAIVDGRIIMHEIGADIDRRVDGEAVHPTKTKSPAASLQRGFFTSG